MFKRSATLWLLLVSVALPAADAPKITAEVVSAPATAGTALAPNLTTGPDGTAWLTWIEKSEDVTRLAVQSVRREQEGVGSITDNRFRQRLVRGRSRFSTLYGG